MYKSKRMQGQRHVLAGKTAAGKLQVRFDERTSGNITTKVWLIPDTTTTDGLQNSKSQRGADRF